MAAQTSQINIAFLTKGEGEVAKAFKRLRGETTRLNRDFKSLSKDSIAKVKNEFNKLGAGARNSLNAMQAQRNALNGLRNMADVTSIEFKELTADIARLDAQMRKASAGGAKGFRGKLSGFAKGAGAIAAGGIFGGPEGAVGGAIGLKVGGPAGAAVGAAIGAQVGMVRQQIAALAQYSAALGLQRKALNLVIGDTNQFNKSQKFLLKTSRDLAIPQDVITRQFTSLTASVVGAGQSVSDAEKVFEAIAAGIRGTGGNLEDMKAAMRATSQVFSKGKVSAEELRQQLGERLPGAFTLFADSMGKTPAELDKALEQGKVTLDDFMGFAETLFEKYGENAKILAKGPEAAGDRLTTAMSELKDSIGQILLPIGAAFQETFSKIVEDINKAIEKFKEFFGIGLENAIKLAEKNIASLEKRLENSRKGSPTFTRLQRDLKLEKGNLASLLLQKDQDSVEGGKGGGEGGGEDKALNDIQKGAKAYFDTIKDFGKQTQDVVAGAFKGMEDALVNFVQTGKLNFSDLARSIIADLTRILIRAAIMKPILSFFGLADGGVVSNGEIKKNALGNAFAKNGIVPYRKGGIVNSPTMFAYGGSNLGIMGEAGPEAIMPLKRGANGKLGVQSSGGMGNIVVNVDASGTAAQSDNARAEMLGNMLGSAVEQELLRQQRPGGLLFS